MFTFGYNIMRNNNISFDLCVTRSTGRKEYKASVSRYNGR